MRAHCCRGEAGPHHLYREPGVAIDPGQRISSFTPKVQHEDLLLPITLQGEFPAQTHVYIASHAAMSVKGVAASRGEGCQGR